jgi:hypothetical protein
MKYSTLPLAPTPSTPTQIVLGERYLSLYEVELKALWSYLRHLANINLSKTISLIDGKPYPYGQCFAITIEVMTILQNVLSKKVIFEEQKANTGLKVLFEFLKAGGKIDRIWGDLRGEYFQNALRVGQYYVDVSNDTVDSQKCPIEILPFEASGITPIRDFNHFAELGECYWKRRFFANTLFPALAPYFPLLSLSQNGVIKIEGNDYTIALSETNQFSPTLEVMKNFSELPKSYKKELFKHLKNSDEFSESDGSTHSVKNIQSVANAPPEYQLKFKEEAIKQMNKINEKLNKIELKGAI